MDKLQVVYYAVFSKQDQGIKKLLKLSLQSTFSTLLFKYSNSYCSVYEYQSKNCWGIDIIWGEMADSEEQG